MELVSAWLVDWSAETLLVFVVLLILTDRLVTRGRLLDEREEKNLWRQNAETQQTINGELTKSNTAYADAALLSQKVMEAVQQKHDLHRKGPDE